MPCSWMRAGHPGTASAMEMAVSGPELEPCSRPYNVPHVLFPVQSWSHVLSTKDVRRTHGLQMLWSLSCLVGTSWLVVNSSCFFLQFSKMLCWLWFLTFFKGLNCSKLQLVLMGPQVGKIIMSSECAAWITIWSPGSVQTIRNVNYLN